MDEKRELELNVEQLVLDEADQQLELDPQKTTSKSDDAVGGIVRGWFLNLSKEDRMIALSFSDNLFLDALLKVAASTWAIADGLGQLPAQTFVGPHSGVEWERMFMIKEFVKLYEVFKEKTKIEVPLVSESVDVISPSFRQSIENNEDSAQEPQMQTETIDVKKTTDCLKELNSDDAFRIHLATGDATDSANPKENTDMKKGLAIATGKTAASLALSSIAQRRHCVSVDVTQMSNFVKNLCLVFPSVVDVVLGRNVAEKTTSPILALSPSLIELSTGMEFLCLFDAVLTGAGRPPFLSDSTYRCFAATWGSPAAADNWLHVLCTSMKSDCNVSLILLVVARLEYAVLEAYCEHAHSLGKSVVDAECKEDMDDAESKPFSLVREEADGSSSDQWVTAPEDSSSDDQNADESSMGGLELSKESPSIVRFVPKSSDEKLNFGTTVTSKVTSTISYIEVEGPILLSRKDVIKSIPLSMRMIKSFFTNDNEGELSDAMSPLTNLLDFNERVLRLQLKASDLLMTPLFWFIRSNEGHFTDLEAIAKAVETVLHYFENRNASSQGFTLLSTGTCNTRSHVIDSVDDSVEAGESKRAVNSIMGCVDITDISASTKKLKRKKKRKKRKNACIDAETLKAKVSLKEKCEVEVGNETEAVGYVEDKVSNPQKDPDLSVTTQESITSTEPGVDVDKLPQYQSGDAVSVESILTKVASEVDEKTEFDENELRDDVVPGDSPEIGKVEGGGYEENEIFSPDENGNGDDDGHAWEKVEARNRSSRKKTADRSNPYSGRSGTHSYFSGSNGHGSYSSLGGTSKKSKGARTPASRKRNANRKMVREILSTVLDAVDDEVKKRKKQQPPRLQPMNHTGQAPAPAAPSVMQRADNSKATTLRDVVVGISVDNSLLYKKSALQPSVGETAFLGPQPKVGAAVDADGNGIAMKSQTRSKSVADQNTAPTVPETMSAVSANSMNTDGLFGTGSFRRSETGIDQDVTRSDSSCEELMEVQKDLRISCSTVEEKDSSPAPPLPTLLSPGNPDSASSSVASSLEVPHGHHHHRSYSASENVGYHLLDVCDRLTRDMNVFMDRRGLALNVRRRERGALLVALQDTLSKLWPGRCQVNMYGSCATELDLPSSDLDLVVCGLDRKGEVLLNGLIHQKSNVKKSGRRLVTGPSDSRSGELNSRIDSKTPHIQSPTGQFPSSPFSPFNPIQLQSINGERVIRLAAELERQPWAVHVKAIPTATVPVVKILADPAKLPGAKATSNATATDWMSHHQHMAAQAAIAAGMNHAVVSSSGRHSSISHYHPLHTALPWRGADVMNGLMSVDITFEGPEHGGIGSTKLSSQIVKEACDDYSCPPERVPLVQVLMVLKEMLAQRRLNEPFSGGLSSYALLLLVEALVEERSVIREELDRVERQRRVVAAGGGNSILGDPIPKQKIRTDKDHPTRFAHRDQTPDSSDIKGSGSQFSQVSSDLYGKGSLVKGIEQRKATLLNASQKRPESGALLSSNSINALESKPTNIQSSRTLNKATSTSSWASVARKNTSLGPVQNLITEQQRSDEASVVQPPSAHQQSLMKPKGNTFADALTRSAETTKSILDVDPTRPGSVENRSDSKPKATSRLPDKASFSNVDKQSNSKESAIPTHCLDEAPEQIRQPLGRLSQSIVTTDSALVGVPQLFPQGSNDVVEVLCSGDTTAGKLLMHFLLFYGQHFDARSTAIDVSGKHPDVSRAVNRTPPNFTLSPYIQRHPGGTIDPVSGMLTVDPIVVYDPLEGAESNNVARSCFLWSNIRWVFAQSYNTLSSAVERSPTPPTTPGRQQHVLATKASGAEVGDARIKRESINCAEISSWRAPFARDDTGQPPVDSPLLELLLSF